jgi:endonuclease/exonuclease/phosphatase family metal-dependent hydrolase
MRLMTFNLRFANPEDGPNAWEYRKELVVETILGHGPHLLGTQEGTVPQLEYLAAHLPRYRPLIGHRQTDPTCQYPTIFYREDQLQAGESGEFWLSETPTVHRSKSWDSAFPRMVTYGFFHEQERDLGFWFINTHLDHISALARLNGARMIREHFFPRRQPMILVGDFNEPPDSPVYREFLDRGSPLQDSWRALNPPEVEVTSQHNFDGSSRGSRIDWILLTPPFGVKEALMITDNLNGRYPSDHFPYAVEVEY